jgi:hypothetical protein
MASSNDPRFDLKHWLKTGLRTLHLLAVAGGGGGVLFALEKSLWIDYWWLALASREFRTG